MTNVQAAVGCAQLEKLDDYVAAKRRIAARYYAVLADMPGIAPAPEAPWAHSIFWLYTVMIDERVCGFDSRSLMAQLAARDIESRPLWQPLHLCPAHRGGPATDCAVAEALYRDGLCLPCSVGLDDDQEEVIGAIVEIHGSRG